MISATKKYEHAKTQGHRCFGQKYPSAEFRRMARANFFSSTFANKMRLAATKARPGYKKPTACGKRARRRAEYLRELNFAELAT